MAKAILHLLLSEYKYSSWISTETIRRKVLLHISGLRQGLKCSMNKTTSVLMLLDLILTWHQISSKPTI